MLKLRLSDVDPSHAEEFCRVVEKVLATQASSGSWAANRLLLDAVGLESMPEIGEAYYREALDYHLGLLLAQIGDDEQAARHLDRSNTLPTNGGDLVFSEHVRLSDQLREKQEAARRRGIPAVLISSMPRAASASLSQTLATALDAPIFRFSAGAFPNSIVVPSWLKRVTSGGAVLHDHFGANAFNVAALANSQVHELFVLIRDPRAAATSAVAWAEEMERRAAGSTDEVRVVEMCREAFAPWLRDWLAVASGPAAPIKVHWIRYRDITTSLSGVARLILEYLSARHPYLKSHLRVDIDEVKANFVTGDDEQWRIRVSRKGQEQMWESLPNDIVELLDLVP